MYQLSPHWTDFCQIWYWGLKICCKTLNFVKLWQKYQVLYIKTMGTSSFSGDKVSRSWVLMGWGYTSASPLCLHRHVKGRPPPLFYMKTSVHFLLPVTLNHHKIALFNCSGITWYVFILMTILIRKHSCVSITMPYIVDSDICYSAIQTQCWAHMATTLSSTTILRTYSCQHHKFKRNGSKPLEKPSRYKHNANETPHYILHTQPICYPSALHHIYITCIRT
jgi:hypothetical protein